MSEMSEPSTGNAEVDRVLASLDQLDSTPVSEHAAVFEAAHVGLRAALAEAGDDPSAS